VIIRGPRPETGWTPISNAALLDEALHFKDRGLLGALLALQPGSSTNVAELARRSPDGVDVVRGCLKRLERRGYVRRVRYRRPDGTWATDTYVYDTPEHATLSIAATGGEDVSAGRSQVGKPVLADDGRAITAGRSQVGLADAAEPTRLNRVGSAPHYPKKLDQDQTNQEPGDDVVAAGRALLAALPPALAARTTPASLTSRLARALAAGWTSPHLADWARGQPWAGARSGALVAARLDELGPPPRRDRAPATPPPTDVCPEHGPYRLDCQPCRAAAVPPPSIPRRPA
jgi:hypothetical protein